jgi:hypothetical protein
MGILFGFTPFILFALLAGVSMSLALWAAFAASFTLGIRDFAQTKTLRILDIGGIALFGLLAVYVGFIQPGLKIQTVRLIIDCGLLLIALGSMIMRNPFTLAYARETTPHEIWATPAFLRANYVITAVWTGAFALTCAADGVANFDNAFPYSLDVAIGLAALGLAVVFTARYRTHLRAQSGRTAPTIR